MRPLPVTRVARGNAPIAAVARRWPGLRLRSMRVSLDLGNCCPATPESGAPFERCSLDRSADKLMSLATHEQGTLAHYLREIDSHKIQEFVGVSGASHYQSFSRRFR